MNRLDSETRAQVINCLIEGCSIRSTVRMTGVAKKTVMRLLVEVGNVCADYQDKVFHNLNCRRLQLDEMWAWIYCKEKRRTEKIAKEHPDAGDIWLWVRLMLTRNSFLVGSLEAAILALRRTLLTTLLAA